MIILVISSYILIKDFLQFKESDNSSKELIDTVITQEDNDDELKIDWEKLEDINKDIIGWIKIENTNIDYPILKDNDNLKYLKHSFDGKYNSNGSIFTLNSNPFNDNVTVIYGHNMKNGSMFGSIDVYSNEQFQKQHPYFYIYIPGYVLKYHIISCSTKAASDIDYRMNNNEDSKTVTLSTCDNDNRNYRCLIEGRLVSESPCQ